MKRKIGCSQCGGDFTQIKKGQIGFSHCEDHRGPRCPDCGAGVRFYHSPGRTRKVCLDKCNGFKEIRP